MSFMWKFTVSQINLWLKTNDRKLTYNSNRIWLSLSIINYFYDFVGQWNANDIAFALQFDEIWRRKQTLLESLFYPMEGHGISMEIVVTFFPGIWWSHIFNSFLFLCLLMFNEFWWIWTNIWWKYITMISVLLLSW